MSGPDFTGFKKKCDRQGCIWFLTILGYPIFASMSILLSLPSWYTTYPFRIMVIFLCLIELKSFGISAALKRIPLSIRIFALFYVCRLMFDIFLHGMSPVAFNTIYLISVVLLPVLAIGRYNNISKFESWSVILAYIGCLLCLSFLLIFFLGVSEEQSTTLKIGRLSYIPLNPISIASVGTLTILAAYVIYKKDTGFNYIAPLVICFIGYMVVSLSISRGPALSMGLVFVILTYLRFGLRKIHIGIVLFLLMVFSQFIVSYITPNVFLGEKYSTIRYSQAPNIPVEIEANSIQPKHFSDQLTRKPDIQQRLHDFILDQSGSERIILQKEAFNQFMQSPIFGSGSFLHLSRDYPHNIFIETAIALGMIGVILLLWILYYGIVAANRAIKTGMLLVPSLFYLSLFQTQFSGTIWNAAIFWLTLTCLTSIPTQTLNNKFNKS